MKRAALSTQQRTANSVGVFVFVLFKTPPILMCIYLIASKSSFKSFSVHQFSGLYSQFRRLQHFQHVWGVSSLRIVERQTACFKYQIYLSNLFLWPTTFFLSLVVHFFNKALFFVTPFEWKPLSNLTGQMFHMFSSFIPLHFYLLHQYVIRRSFRFLVSYISRLSFSIFLSDPLAYTA